MLRTFATNLAEASLVRVYEAQRIAYNDPPTPAWLAKAVDAAEQRG
jgi:hypothetical protein